VRRSWAFPMTLNHESEIDESNYYELYSVDTAIFTPPHTITIHLIYSVSTKNFKTQQPTCTEHLPEQQPSQQLLLLRTLFDRYVLIHPTTHCPIPLLHSISTKNFKTQQPTCIEHLPKTTTFPSLTQATT